MKKTIQTGRGMISLATLVAIWSVSSVKSLPGLAISPILGDLNKIFPKATDLEIQMLTSLPSLLIIPFVLLAGKLSVGKDKLKILAIGTKSDVYPNAPTFAEQGYEGNYYGWAGIAAPKGTPKEILDRLAAISEEIVKDPEYIKAIKNMNATPDYSTGEAWMKQLKEQYAEMNKVLTDLGLTGNK